MKNPTGKITNALCIEEPCGTCASKRYFQNRNKEVSETG